MSGRQRPSSAAPGAHHLRDPAVVGRLVSAAPLGPGDLVLDLGAGYGALTVALVRTGADVLAVERFEPAADRLRRRLAGTLGGGRVRVVEADIRDMPLPRRPFRVVANLPFAVTSAVLARLLDDPAGRLDRADLLVQAEAAARLVGTPRDARGALRQARFGMRVASRVPPSAFSPPPRVTAAHLVVVRRPLAGGRRGQALLADLVSAAWRDRHRAARQVLSGILPPRSVHRVWTRHALPPSTPAEAVPPAAWLDLLSIAGARRSL